MHKYLFPALVVLSFFVSTGRMLAFELKEVDRFETRLPVSLAYSTATCTLWVSGNSHLVSRVTLQGKRVEARYSGIGSFAFAALFEGKLLAVSLGGNISELLRSGHRHWGRIEAGILHARPKVNEDRITGGDIRPDGTFIVSTTEQSALKLYKTSRRPTLVARMPSGGTFRGVAFDPVVNRTYALFRSEGFDHLVVLDANFELVTRRPLAEWGRLAEGIAIQPETGDLFVSFLQDKSFKGEIVRFIVEDSDGDEVSKSRPSYACGIS